MDAVSFVVFGPDHLGALALTLAAIVAAALVVRRDPHGAAARRLRLTVLTALPSLWVAEQLMALVEGWGSWDILPLHLCDVALVLAWVGLFTLRVRPVEPLYFFAVAGTVPAVLTPELDHGFPAFRFLIYFTHHGLTLVATAVLVTGFGLVPRRGAWWRTFLVLNACALLVTPVNVLLDTNFLYLRDKPRTATPFDWFGPWPWYILTLEVLFLVAFFLLDLPLRSLRARWADRSMEAGTRDEAPSSPTEGRTS